MATSRDHHAQFSPHASSLRAAASVEASDYQSFVFDALGAGDYDYDLRLGTLRRSVALNRIHAFPDDYPLTLEDIRRRYHPDDRPVLTTIVPDAVERGQRRFQREFRLVLPEDGIRWVLARGEVLFADDGHPRFVRGAMIDITARKQAELALRASEERQAYLLRLSDALRSLADPAAIMMEASRVLGEHLGATRVLYGEVSDDDAEMIVQRNYVSDDAPVLTGRYRMADFGPALIDALSAGRTVLVPDIAADTQLSADERAAFAAFGIAAVASVPLRKNDRFVANLNVQQRTPRNWTPNDVALIEETAERTWAAVERARSEGALRESEDRYRSLFDSMDQGVQLCQLIRDESGDVTDVRILRVNRAWERLMGVKPESVIGRRTSECLPNPEKAWVELWERVVRTGHPERYEQCVGDLDRWFEVFVSPVDGDRFMALFTDTTTRGKHEAALRESEARQTFLLCLGDALRPLADPHEIQRTACRILGDHLDASRVLYVETGPDEGTVVVHAEQARDEIVSVVGTHIFDDFGPSLTNELRAGRRLVVENTQAVESLSVAERTAFSALSIHSLVGEPMIKGGRMVAFLAVHQAKPRVWTPLEISLIGETAERTWAAVERARAEAALRVSEHRYRTLIQNIRDYAVFLLDSAGRILTWSPGATAIFGYEESEILGQSTAVLFTPEDVVAGEHHLELVKARDEGRAFDDRWHIRRNGEKFWSTGVTTPFSDASGTVRGFVKVARDLTEQKRLDDQREQLYQLEAEARTKAEQASREKDEFLTVISHELRTPLAAILIWSGQMRTGRLNPQEQERALFVIEQSARIQSRLIEDLLDVSRLRSGMLQLRKQATDPITVVEAVVEMIRPQAEGAKLTLTTNLDSTIGYVSLDPQRLQQVLWNVLINAVKFTLAGGSISVELRRRDDSFDVRIADTGQGISPQFLPHLFEPFRQEETGVSREHGGLGVGLALARSLVELHGGSIRAESAGAGRGATFTITLPIHRAEVVKPMPGLFIAPPRHLKDARVLLVDDDPNAREAMSWSMMSVGVRVHAVGSAKEALDWVAVAPREEAPEILISDIGLPGMDGYELVRRLHALSAGAGRAPIPSGAVSAFPRDTNRSRVIEAGFDVHLTKPFELEELLDMVEELIGVARQGAESVEFA